MCTGNCKCGNGNEQVEAVRRKLERTTESALDRLEQAVEAKDTDITAEIAELNRKLFDGITKKELVESIVNEFDELDFAGLIARPDVAEVLEKSQTIKQDAVMSMFEIGGKLQSAEMQINELARSILDDVIIFGVTEQTQEALLSFEAKVEEILAIV